MNRYEEEIVTAQFADDPNDLVSPDVAKASSGLSVGCILSIVVGLFFGMLLAVVGVVFCYVAWNAGQQNQVAVAEEQRVAIDSLNVDSLAESVEVFEGAKDVETAVENHPDFDGINLLFQKWSETSDWENVEAIYRYVDFKKHAQEVCSNPATKSFFGQYTRRDIEKTVREFGFYVRPFSRWKIAEIQQLSSSERLVYVQVQAKYDVAVKRCRVWVTKNRFGNWKVFDWEDVSQLSRLSSEAASLIAEPNSNYANAYNQYYDLIETEFQNADSQLKRERILKRCESLRVRPEIRPAVLLNVGEYWYSIDEPKQVFRCLDKIENKDLIPEVYRLEGDAYTQLEEYELAIEKYKLFIDHVGAHSDVLQSLVNCCEEIGDEDQQKTYQLERFKAWPVDTCYFDADEILRLYKAEPAVLFNAITCSSHSEAIYRKFFDQLAGNPFALAGLRLVKKHFDNSRVESPLLTQRVTAFIALAEGKHDEFKRLMVDILKQAPTDDVDQKWTEAVEYDYHRELFDASEDKAAAFEAMARIYSYGDWYGSEKAFGSICDTAYAKLPGNDYVIYHKATQLFDAGRYRQAMPLFESIDGEMDGEFTHLNESITESRLICLLNQKEFGKALELAKQKNSIQQLFEAAIEQQTPEVLEKISDEELEDGADLVLKGLRASEKNQGVLARKYFSNYLKGSDSAYRFERVAMTGLLRAQSETSALTIFRRNSSFSMYRYLASILTKNKDWQTLESLSKTAMKSLKSDFEENDYAESNVLETFSEAQWNQQKYRSILLRYIKLAEKQELDDSRFVLWAACKLKDFRFARQFCDKNSTSYGFETNAALVSAFEGNMQTFEKAIEEFSPYGRAELDETLLALGLDERFRRRLYQQAEGVDIDYESSNLKSIEAVFAADWKVEDKQIRTAVAKLTEVSETKFELIEVPNKGQARVWAAKTDRCGVTIEVRRIDSGKFTVYGSSVLSRRMGQTLSSDHQKLIVSVFPIQCSKNPSSVRSDQQISIDFDLLAATLFVSITDQPPSALNSGEGWSDGEALFERVKQMAEGKPFKKLTWIDVFYGYASNESLSDYSPETFKVKRELALAFRDHLNSTDPKKQFLATVEHVDVPFETVQVQLDETFEAFSFGPGATFNGTVTKPSEPFGIYQMGDRLEFTDSQIQRWK